MEPLKPNGWPTLPDGAARCSECIRKATGVIWHIQILVMDGYMKQLEQPLPPVFLCQTHWHDSVTFERLDDIPAMDLKAIRLYYPGGVNYKGPTPPLKP